jgi:pimeloyl-ACP methyl ester carboxylesterase
MTRPDAVRLWWETEGDGPDDVLLVPGRGDSTDGFPGLVSDRLVAAGCRVIRFDPRDTGRSDDGGSTYTMSTMADDAIGVLDAAGTAVAHIVGFSMGGLILVDLAARYGSRVATATFLAAMSPDPDGGFGPRFFTSLDTELDEVDVILSGMGSPTAADRAWVTDELARSAARCPPRPDAGARHQEAAYRFGWPEHERLGDIGVPTLIVHGTDDQSLPIAHGHAFAKGIDHSVLHLIDDMGHLPSEHHWDQISQLLIEHIEAART